MAANWKRRKQITKVSQYHVGQPCFNNHNNTLKRSAPIPFQDTPRSLAVPPGPASPSLSLRSRPSPTRPEGLQASSRAFRFPYSPCSTRSRLAAQLSTPFVSEPLQLQLGHFTCRFSSHQPTQG